MDEHLIILILDNGCWWHGGPRGQDFNEHATKTADANIYVQPLFIFLHVVFQWNELKVSNDPGVISYTTRLFYMRPCHMQHNSYIG